MTSFFHVGLCVSSVERSLKFYERVLGMEVVKRQELESAEFDELTANPGSHIRFAYLRLGSFILQLVEYAAGGGRTLPVAHNSVGSPHLSFFVEDVDATYERVTALPEMRHHKIVDLNVQMRTFYVFDPDGVPVELMQLAGGLLGLTDQDR
jgi:catechol 2,3-dioxygenase-like lactoylglutathione lyase family enzyme